MTGLGVKSPLIQKLLGPVNMSGVVKDTLSTVSFYFGSRTGVN